MIEYIYEKDPHTTILTAGALLVTGVTLGITSVFTKKTKTKWTLRALAAVSSAAAGAVMAKNPCVGIYSKDPQEVIDWLHATGATNIPKKYIRKTGHAWF